MAHNRDRRTSVKVRNRRRPTVRFGSALRGPGSQQATAWVAATVCGGGGGGALVNPPGAGAWKLITRTIEEQLLAGLAMAAIERGVPTDDEQREDIRTLRRRAIVHDLLAESVLHEVHGLLTDAGIEWRLLKGLATAHLWYGSPDLRHTGDVDVLVREQDYARTVALFDQLAPRSARLQGPATEGVSRETSFLHRTGVEIDVHRRIEGALPGSRVAEQLLWQSPQQVGFRWGQASSMSPDLMALHLLLHLSTRPRLTSVADAFRSLERNDIDWDRVAALAAQRGRQGSIAWGVEQASRWDPDGRMDWLSAALRPGLLVRSITAGTHRWSYGQTLGWLASGEHRMRRLLEVARPSQEFRAWRGTGGGDGVGYERFAPSDDQGAAPSHDSP